MTAITPLPACAKIESDDIPDGDVLNRFERPLEQFEKYVSMSKKVPSEVLTSLSGIEEPGRLADTIAAHMSVDLEEKQRILRSGLHSGAA